MKRRLTRAYDHMTMPEHCASRIEQQLQLELQKRKTGQYAKAISPVRPHRRSWTAAAVAVCLILVLSVGGSALVLTASEWMRGNPTETTAAPETIRPETPQDYYAVATEKAAEEVETFAQRVKRTLLQEEWDVFSGMIHYPIAILDRTVTGDSGMLNLFAETMVSDAFLEELRKEDCSQMFCNWQGICMGSGQIWINEVDGELKITAINGLFTDLHDPEDYEYRQYTGTKYAIVRYNGRAERLAMPEDFETMQIAAIGDGTPVIAHGDAVKVIRVPATVSTVSDYAFVNCAALESVWFQGDAPAEAEHVFDGSENVFVYYPEEAEGWGDTWCGRPTLPYSTGHVSLGTVVVPNSLLENANQAFGEILRETDGFYCHELEAELTISSYCEKRSEETGKTVTVSSFTLVDMDRDGIKELILRLQIEGDPREDYLILRYQDNNPGIVYCFMEPEQRISDLRKDGSFYWRGEGPEYRESRLILEGNSAKVLSSLGLTDAPEVLWHTWPCQKPELVVQSYAWTGTGRSRFPGNHYYHFEGLVLGSMGNDWNLQKDQLLRYGMICQEDEGTVAVFDPDAPGTALYGTLTNENGRVQLAELGYYICTEEKEYAAEARGLLDAEPEYVADAHLPALGSMGRRVYSPEELVSYLGFTRYSDEVILERNAAREVLENFTSAWIAGDEKAMKRYLADDFREDARRNGSEDLPVGPVELVAILNLPSWGEECYVTAEFRETEQDHYFSICLDLVKQQGDWKVRSCYYGSP